jgi:DNA-binding GntR family transcriptional regulator
VLFAPPVQRPLHSDVYEALRRALVSGALTGGQRIKEAEIARQMQISRAPIREAIRLLEQEGWLVSLPRRGTFVAAVSRDDVEEVYTLRADIEARAARHAVARMTAKHLGELEDLVAEMQAAAVAGQMDRLHAADIQFHRVIVEAAGWSRLRKIWEGLHPQTLTLHTLRTLNDWSLPEHVDRHLPILQALRLGDADAAAAALSEHILGVGHEVMRRHCSDAAVPAVAGRA